MPTEHLVRHLDEPAMGTTRCGKDIPHGMRRVSDATIVNCPLCLGYMAADVRERKAGTYEETLAYRKGRKGQYHVRR